MEKIKKEGSNLSVDLELKVTTTHTREVVDKTKVKLRKGSLLGKSTQTITVRIPFITQEELDIRLKDAQSILSGEVKKVVVKKVEPKDNVLGEIVAKTYAKKATKKKLNK